MKKICIALSYVLACTCPLSAMEPTVDDQDHLIHIVENLATAVIHKSLTAQHTSLYAQLPKQFQNSNDALIIHASIAHCIADSFAARAQTTFAPTDQVLTRFNEALNYIKTDMPERPELLVGLGCVLYPCHEAFISPELKEYYNSDNCPHREAVLMAQGYYTLCSIYAGICSVLFKNNRTDDYQYNFEIYEKLVERPYATRAVHTPASTPHTNRSRRNSILLASKPVIDTARGCTSTIKNLFTTSKTNIMNRFSKSRA